MKHFITLILLLAFGSETSAQAVRKYSNEFLNIGVDAAALAMANAVTANTNDVNSGYWNPAGLINLEDNQLSLMHASYFANIALYDYAAFAKPLDDRTALGVSLIRFGVDDILNELKSNTDDLISKDSVSDVVSRNSRRGVGGRKKNLSKGRPSRSINLNLS